MVAGVVLDVLVVADVTDVVIGVVAEVVGVVVFDELQAAARDNDATAIPPATRPASLRNCRRLMFSSF